VATVPAQLAVVVAVLQVQTLGQPITVVLVDTPDVAVAQVLVVLVVQQLLFRLVHKLASLVSPVVVVVPVVHKSRQMVTTVTLTLGHNRVQQQV
jgi:hypothetical protein